MAKQSKVMGSVTGAVRFITEQLQSSVAEKMNELEITKDQARKLNILIDASIQKSYGRVMDTIIKSIDD